MQLVGLASITVPAIWTDPDGVVRRDPAVFTLGVGRCGKDVTGLALNFGATLLHIQQLHRDGTEKTFTYAVKDLVGRVVTEQELKV